MICALWVAACTQARDDKALNAERERTVQRYDTFLAAASNGKHLSSAGGNGVLVTSVDGGKTWTRDMLPSPSSVVAMSACPDGTFAALDFYRKVWIRDAQARNWQPRRVEGNFNPLAITCDARNFLWVVGSFSTIVSSSDHGNSWNARPPGLDAILTSMQWVDADHGYIAGEFGTLLATHDGGATWAKQAGLPAELYPYSLVFTDIQHGWVSSLAGTILHTADGGKTWVMQTNATGVPLYALLNVGAQVYGVGGGGRVLKFEGYQWVTVANTLQASIDLVAGAHLESRGLLVAGSAGTLQVVNLSPAVAQKAQP
jgi:photosystem II stability/assembly factor-like uncharacterized protein